MSLSESELDASHDDGLFSINSTARKVTMNFVSLLTIASYCFLYSRVLLSMWRKRTITSVAFPGRILVLLTTLGLIVFLDFAVGIYYLLWNGSVSWNKNVADTLEKIFEVALSLMITTRDILTSGIAFLELLRLISVQYPGLNALNWLMHRQGLQTAILVAVGAGTGIFMCVHPFVVVLHKNMVVIEVLTSVFLIGALYWKSAQLSFHFTQEEILPTKLALLHMIWHLTGDLLSLCRGLSRDIASIIHCALTVLFPASYLLIYETQNFSQKGLNNASLCSIPSEGVDRSSSCSRSNDTEMNPLFFTLDADEEHEAQS